MTFRKIVRIIATSSALLALLLFATAVGEAVEAAQHHICAENPNCPICHLGQQVAGSAASTQAVAQPQRLGPAWTPQDLLFLPLTRPNQLTTRAPPAA